MKENYFLTFVKGLVMGIADVIPGISGGTMALITGIYDRFIDGLSNIGSFFKDLIAKLFGKNKKKFSKLFVEKVDYKMFIPLLFGTTLAFVIGSLFIPNLIETYPALVYSFFAGLIISSAFLIYKTIKVHSFLGFIFGTLGLVVGFVIATLPVQKIGVAPSYPFFMLVGAIAIIAMLLPGISGSYIVLMFGQYHFLLSILSDFSNKWSYFVVFSIGGLIGILGFSKILSYLLKKYHAITMFTLVGIMLGALYRPINDVVQNVSSTQNIAFSILLFLVGIGLVIGLHNYSNKKK